MTLLTMKLAIHLYKQIYSDPSNRDPIPQDQPCPTLKMALSIEQKQLRSSDGYDNI